MIEIKDNEIHRLDYYFWKTWKSLFTFYFYKWNDLMEIGKEVNDESLEKRMSAQSPNKCCSLIYTVSWNQPNYLNWNHNFSNTIISVASFMRVHCLYIIRTRLYLEWYDGKSQRCHDFSRQCKCLSLNLTKSFVHVKGYSHS